MVFDLVMNDIKGESQNTIARHEGRADTQGTCPLSPWEGLAHVPTCPGSQARFASYRDTGFTLACRALPRF